MVKVRNAEDVTKLNLTLNLHSVGKMRYYTQRAPVKSVTTTKNKSLPLKIKLK